MRKRNLEKAIVVGLIFNVLYCTNVLAADEPVIIDGTKNNGIVVVPEDEYNYVFGSRVVENDKDAINNLVGNVIINNENNNINITNAVIGNFSNSVNGNAFSAQGNITINGGEYVFKNTVWNDRCSGIYGSYAHSVSGSAEAINGIVELNGVSVSNQNSSAIRGIYGSLADVGKNEIPASKKAKADSGTVNISNSVIDVPIGGSFASEETSGSSDVSATNGAVNIGSNSIIRGSIYGSVVEGRAGDRYASDGTVNIEGDNIKVLSSTIMGSSSEGIGESDGYATSRKGAVKIKGESLSVNATIRIVGSNVRASSHIESIADFGQVNIEDASVEVTNKNAGVGGIYGGLVLAGPKGYSNNNQIVIKNANVKANLYGGFIQGNEISDSSYNKINIKDSKVSSELVYGGMALTYNNIGIDPQVSYKAISSNNSIILEGKNTGLKDIIAGYAAVYSGGSANIENNTIELLNAKDADYSNSNLMGFEYYIDNVENATISNNNLIVDNWSGIVGSVNNFNNIKFQNIEWENAGKVLTLKNNEADSLKDTAVDVEKSLTINNSDTKLHKGDYMYFVYHDDESVNLGTQKVNGNGENVFTSGVAVQGKGKVEVEGDGDVKYTITDVETTDQSKNTTDYNSVAAAFLITGSDLVVDGLNSMEQDQLFGTKTFAIVEGVDKTFEVADDLKVNGWNGLYGVGNIKKTEDGTMSYAAFFENGTANYRTYNTFMDEAFRGDGSIVYNGGGIAGRYKGDDGVYVEASVRAGLLKNQMKNVFRDGNGQTYGYKTESPYWALHAGVGRIYDVGYNRDLDVYARYYHTYNDGDSFTVAGDHFDVDDIVSDRLRLGLRYNTNKFNKWKTYYGAAWEYEFNGDSKVHINDDSVATESLKGSSCFAEIGFNYQRDKSSPWDFEGRVRGYAGHVKGFSGMLRATYSF